MIIRGKVDEEGYIKNDGCCDKQLMNILIPLHTLLFRTNECGIQHAKRYLKL